MWSFQARFYGCSSSLSEAHMRSFRKLKAQDPSQKIVLEEYLLAIETGIERLSRLTEKIKEILPD